jgi:hypothetical protein
MRPLKVSRLSDVYRRALDSAGLITKTGRIRLASLREKIQAFWRSEDDEKLDRTIDETLNDASFPDMVFRGQAKNLHPVKHLLLIGPLFQNMRQLLLAYHQLELKLPKNWDQSVEPHADCRLEARRSEILAHLSEGASLRSVSSCAKVSVSTAKAIAVSHNLPVSRRTSKVSSGMYRDIWRKLFVGNRTEIIARHHAISKASVEQVLREHPYLKELRRKIRFYGARAVHRGHLERWLKENPMLYRNSYRTGHAVHYSWLYKNDRSWLDASLPKPIPRNRRRTHRTAT